MYIAITTGNDAADFSKKLKGGNWIVLYYADWCGHCQAMKPEWQKVVGKLKDSGKINIADVKSEVIDQLEHKPQIEGFPTIKIYNNGKETAKFEDERSADKIEKFAIDNSTKESSVGHSGSVSSINILEEPKSSSGNRIKKAKNRTRTIIINKIGNKLEALSKSLKKTRVKSPKKESLKESIREKKEEILKSHSSIDLNLSNNDSTKKNSKVGKASKIKQPVIPLTIEDILAMPAIIKSSSKVNKTNNNTHPLSLSCSEIRKAKPCKANPNCEFDLIKAKCFDKTLEIETFTKSTKSTK
jgi:thiol-disulfide isomerase/thioredoxin